MTTRGVRAYVEGLQAKFKLDPAKLTKMQTGGPDGDLGSNEIKLGNERTVGVVDGSGVLFDPAGIDHAELVRLASHWPRLPVEKFDRAKLSPGGFLVLVSDTDVRLPDGTVVTNGATFRNVFHLNARVTADFFVPCGGRPQAVNADNVDAFLYGAAADGSALPEGARPTVPRFKYIVEGEGSRDGGGGGVLCGLVRVARCPPPAAAGASGAGANLFFTEDARLVIEARGIPLFKDSSANKGAHADTRGRGGVSLSCRHLHPPSWCRRRDVVVAGGDGGPGADRRRVRGAHVPAGGRARRHARGRPRRRARLLQGVCGGGAE
jgi:glutamate dehydrogenase